MDDLLSIKKKKISHLKNLAQSIGCRKCNRKDLIAGDVHYVSDIDCQIYVDITCYACEYITRTCSYLY